MSQSPLHCWWTCLVYSSPDPNQKEQQTGSHLGGERAMNQRADLRTPAGRARGAPLHALWWPGREKAPEREDMYTQSWFTLPCSRDSHHCKATILQYTPIKVIKKKKKALSPHGEKAWPHLWRWLRHPSLSRSFASSKALKEMHALAYQHKATGRVPSSIFLTLCLL